MRDTIREYYDAVHEHDWTKLASTLADDVVRIGLLSDVEDDISRGKEPYVAFVSKVIGSFEYHSMRVIKIFYSEDRRWACAETTETIQPPGQQRITLHCLKIHQLDETGLITSINQFRKLSDVALPTSVSVSAVMAEPA
jgi:hypothetical protein